MLMFPGVARKRVDGSPASGLTERTKMGEDLRRVGERSLFLMSDREQSWEKARTCSMSGCRREVFDRGWCKRHFANWRRTGDPRKVLVRWSPAARI